MITESGFAGVNEERFRWTREPQADDIEARQLRVSVPVSILCWERGICSDALDGLRAALGTI